MAEELPDSLIDLALVLAATASKSASQALSKANEVNERAQFAKGDKGDPGLKGDKGDPGKKGDKGDPGEKGDKGDPGQKGDKGDLGQKGDKGDPGEKGDKGDPGQKGDKGDPGLNGLPGVGIAKLEEPVPGIMRVKLTDGKSKDFILPRGPAGKDAKAPRQGISVVHHHEAAVGFLEIVPGSGIAIDNTHAGRPVISVVSADVPNDSAKIFLAVLTETNIEQKAVTLPVAPVRPDRTLVQLEAGVAQYANSDFFVEGSELKWSGLAMEFLVEAGQRLHVTYQ